MRTSRADANPELSGRQSTAQDGPAALLDFAVTQLTMDRPLARTLPRVLERFVGGFGLRAAIAFRPVSGQPPPPGSKRQPPTPRSKRQPPTARSARQPPAPRSARQPEVTVLAAHPPEAAEPELLAGIGRLPADRGSAPLAPVELPVLLGGRACRALVVYPPPADGQYPCAVALIGDETGRGETGRGETGRDETGRDDEVRATAHATATLVAAKLAATAEVGQEQLFDSLVATAIPGVLITDGRGKISHISQSFSSMFDVAAPERLTGTPAVRLIRRVQHVFADPAEFLRRTLGTLRAAEPSSGEQITAADGRTIESDYWPVFVDDQYLGAIWLLWDMSDRVELERQREEQNARLRELDKARNDFVAMISHELRTPLTSIVSFSELIKGESAGLTPDGLRFLDVIERNADRMLRLIGDLLLLSRLEAGMLPLDLAPVSVPGLVEEAVRTHAHSAAIADIGLEATAGSGPPVLGDVRRLHQVLDNLLSNAIKFSERGGQVRVEASCDGKTWRIDVCDTGIGIPPDEAARLFGRFVRASNARIAGLPGTGLGLSVVKMIVEMHGGQVDVDTALDRGTTLTVYLPVAP